MAQNALDKFYFPHFDGVDPLPWIYTAEQFFEACNVFDDHSKISFAFNHMRGDALDWFMYFHRNGRVNTWENFLDEFTYLYDLSEYRYLFGESWKLRQNSSTVDEKFCNNNSSDIEHTISTPLIQSQSPIPLSNSNPPSQIDYTSTSKAIQISNAAVQISTTHPQNPEQTPSSPTLATQIRTTTTFSGEPYHDDTPHNPSPLPDPPPAKADLKVLHTPPPPLPTNTTTSQPSCDVRFTAQHTPPILQLHLPFSSCDERFNFCSKLQDPRDVLDSFTIDCDLIDAARLFPDARNKGKSTVILVDCNYELSSFIFMFNLSLDVIGTNVKPELVVQLHFNSLVDFKFVVSTGFEVPWPKWVVHLQLGSNELNDAFVLFDKMSAHGLAGIAYGVFYNFFPCDHQKMENEPCKMPHLVAHIQSVVENVSHCPMSFTYVVRRSVPNIDLCLILEKPFCDDPNKFLLGMSVVDGEIKEVMVLLDGKNYNDIYDDKIDQCVEVKEALEAFTEIQQVGTELDIMTCKSFIRCNLKFKAINGTIELFIQVQEQVNCRGKKVVSFTPLAIGLGGQCMFGLIHEDGKQQSISIKAEIQSTWMARTSILIMVQAWIKPPWPPPMLLIMNLEDKVL